MSQQVSIKQVADWFKIDSFLLYEP